MWGISAKDLLKALVLQDRTIQILIFASLVGVCLAVWLYFIHPPQVYATSRSPAEALMDNPAIKCRTIALDNMETCHVELLRPDGTSQHVLLLCGAHGPGQPGSADCHVVTP